MSSLSRNIILTGFMGTGKTAVGRLIARELGLKFVDSDDEIEKRSGALIQEIFARFGESHFRSLEKNLCREIAQREGQVVATGGGMPVDPENRRLLSSAGVVICLRCEVQEILRRVGNSADRPMLQAIDPVHRVIQLLGERESAYAVFPFQLDTTHLSVESVAARVLAMANGRTESARFLSVNVPGGAGYTLSVGPGTFGLLGEMLRDRGITSRIAVVTDTNLESLYLPGVVSLLQASGFNPFSCIVPAGEASKNLTQLASLYDVFLQGRLDRRGAVIALGGGIIGDLAGYAAATFMRGVGFVQCPTTLLAMIDASIGGKTGINLPQGKNLAGAFKQPSVVLADTDTLSTLPKKEIQTGMAEFIKHAVIGDKELFENLESSREAPSPDTDLIIRSVAVKARIVEQDPFESGYREVLNFGHTVGHAIEQCSRYSISHGEAVSIGMVAAARISHKMKLCASNTCDRLEALFVRTDLPIKHNLDPDDVIAGMAADKKAIEGSERFVLINDIGSVAHGHEVAPELVRQVLQEIKSNN
ncbi:MAG: 3-dehydroquinate synthase [Desulfomonilaceae bacterium]